MSKSNKSSIIKKKESNDKKDAKQFQPEVKQIVVSKKSLKKSASLKNSNISSNVELENDLFPSPPATPPLSERVSLVSEPSTSSDSNSDISQRLKSIQKEKGFDSSKTQNATNASLCNLFKKHFLLFLRNETDLKWEEANTGSYYDKTQVSQAVEFDVVMNLKSRFIKIIYFPDTGNDNKSMCSLTVNSSANCEKFLRKIMGIETESKLARYLSPKKFYDHFKSLVKIFFKKPRREFLIEVETAGYKMDKLTVEPAKTKPGCPAVTLNVIKSGEFLFSMDFVPAVQLVEWPKPAENWTCNWIPENIIKCLKNSSDIGAEQKPELNIFRNKYAFSVPKLDRKEIDKDPDQCKLWQLSFGEIEKCVILHIDGMFFEPSQCTKNVLKLLKQDVNEFNEQLKTEDKLISSYHMKQLVFSVRSNCKNKNDWLEKNILKCYKKCLSEFIKKIRNEELPMFFIPDVNLLKNRLSKKDKEDILLFFKNKLKTISNASQLVQFETVSSSPEDF